MKKTPAQKKGDHKEMTSGTSEARFKVLQALPKSLGTLALRTQPPCCVEAQQKGPSGEEPRPWLTALPGHQLAHGKEPF